MLLTQYAMCPPSCLPADFNLANLASANPVEKFDVISNTATCTTWYMINSSAVSEKVHTLKETLK